MTTYSRSVLIDRQVSVAGDSITDTWRVLYPDTSVSTQIYHGINKHIDAYKYEVYGGAPYILGIDTPAQWDSVRYMFSGSTPGVSELEYFTKGLGLTYTSSFATSNGGHYSNELIYYNKGGRHAGTPYYSFTTFINTISDNLSIDLYPNPTTSQLHLTITDAGAANVELVITDILGQRVYSSNVLQSETTHDISGLSSGIYTWRLAADGATISTGKMVKQ